MARNAAPNVARPLNVLVACMTHPYKNNDADKDPAVQSQCFRQHYTAKLKHRKQIQQACQLQDMQQHTDSLCLHNH